MSTSKQLVLALSLVFSFGMADLASAARPHVSWQPATGYSEGTLAVLLASALDISDRDSRMLTAATVRIRGAGEHGESLSFVDQLGRRRIGWTPIDTNDAPSVNGLRLAGRASIADYETALRSVWYRHAGDDPSRSRRIVIRVRDGSGKWSRRSEHTLSITRANDAPQLAPASAEFDYRLGGGPQRISPGLALLDPDSRISRATVQITEGFSAAEDQLMFENRSAITGTYDSGTGVLTLTGAASPAAYQAALRSVAYMNTSADPANKSRAITFSVTDVFGTESNFSVWNEPNLSP